MWFVAELGLLLIAPAWAGTFEATFPAEALVRFDLDSHAGNIQIRANASTRQVEVRATQVDWHEGCSIDMGQEQERAWAKVTSQTRAGAQCRLDFHVVVFPQTRLTVHLGQGDVHVAGLAADLTADIGQGDLTLEEVTGSLDAEMGHGQLAGQFGGPRFHVELGSGEVQLEQLVAPAAVALGTGNVLLSYARAPAGSIDVRTGTGMVRIVLPPDTPVATDLTVGQGSKRVVLPVRADALTRIAATSDVGRVAVEAGD